VLYPAVAVAAERPNVRLQYQRAANASDCPDAVVVQQAVRARLGFDPFHEPANLFIQASVSRAGRDLRAKVVLTDPEGASGERQLDSQRSDCTELASAMELAIAIAIDPLSGARPDPAMTPPAPEPAAAAPATSAPPEGPPAEVEARPAPKGLGLDANVGAQGNWGAAPSLSFGFALGAGLRIGDFALTLEGRADLPASKDAGGGRVKSSLYSAALLPCYHLSYFAACAFFAAGAMVGSGEDLVQPRQVTTFYSALGLRGVFEFPKEGPVALRVNLDAAAPLSRTTYTVGSARVWTSQFIAISLGIGAAVRLR
jgi:hypothetical protein